MKPSVRIKPLRSITKTRAKQLAAVACVPSRRAFKCYDTLPPECKIYPLPEEPCWFIRCPWGDNLDGRVLRSGRLIAISRRTGQILYHGPAFDEG